VLVRPDMFVAWRARAASAQASELLVDVFGKLLGFKENAAVAARA
jgi:2,4-dichlorophenol 6-monooxygenase